MDTLISPIATLLAILTVGTDIAIVLFFLSAVVGIVVPTVKALRSRSIQFIQPYARILAFLIAFVAMSGSLFYSEIAKYTPCLLCWWQRIFMYPQTLLIGMGIVKNDKNVADYSIGFSVVGAVIAMYHYYIQLGGKSFFSCAQIGYSSECSQRFTLEFGYVSIPMMALSAFVAIWILMSISRSPSVRG